MAIRVLCGCWLVLAMALPMYDVVNGIPQPKEQANVVRGMVHLKTFTPADSVIWAWWDHGHAIRFFADRATINDGGIHSGSRTTYTAWPLCTTNERAAANFMRFYAVRGGAGIETFVAAAGLGHDDGFLLLSRVLGMEPAGRRELLQRLRLVPLSDARGRDEWINYLFPSVHRPLYLFLDDRTFQLAYWWHWFGTWSVARREGLHPFYLPLYLQEVQGPLIRCRAGVTIDTGRGRLLRDRAEPLSIASISMFRPGDSKGGHVIKMGEAGIDNVVEWVEGDGYGVLTDRRTAETVFNKLFVRQQGDNRFFKPVFMNRFAWQVTGD